MENTIICKRCGHVKEQHGEVELAMPNPKEKPAVVYKCKVENCNCVDYKL